MTPRPRAVRVARAVLGLALVVCVISFAAGFYEGLLGMTDNPDLAEQTHAASTRFMILAGIAFMVGVGSFGAQLRGGPTVAVRQRLLAGGLAIAAVAGAVGIAVFVSTATRSHSDAQDPGIPEVHETPAS